MASEARYCVEYATTGRSSCKKCKSKIEKGVCRIGKITPNPFSDDGGDMKVWYHSRCMFETLQRARATTKKIESPADLEGFSNLKDPEKDEIKQFIKDFAPKSPAKGSKKKTQTTLPVTPKKGGGGASASGATVSPVKASAPTTATPTSSEGGGAGGSSNPDNSFRQYRRLCEDLENEPSYNSKTKLVQNYIKRGNSGDGFSGDLYLLVKLLLPGAGKKRVYNLQSKQIVKILSQAYGCSLDDMVEDLEKGDVAETAKKFFEEESVIKPAAKSTLTLFDVDSFLDRMEKLTKEDEQKKEFLSIIRKCTGNDIKYIIRLIKHDLRTNAGPKHIMDALDPNAYAAFQVSHDLEDVVQRVLSKSEEGAGGKSGLTKELSIRVTLMTPVKPMLAEACRSVAMAMKKCPNGMFAEIKYDGERVQVHKQGTTFQYFSRSLKPVQGHKVAHIKDYLPQACPHGDSMILDCEVLMVDIKTGDPLPFGTLGIHKKNAFKDAVCCLFIFDLLYFNGESLLDTPIIKRRKLLEENVKEVKNHIMLSEAKLVKQPEELSDLIMTVIKKGLEGLVLKDTKSIYEPGKRHWLKVKKDYLEGGAMADTADLIVLGAYYGTGSKGGLMSVFLMGVYDKTNDRFCTVCKCGNGHDDATIMKLQDELDMTKISKDYSKVPSWLNINKGLTPDLVVSDPKSAPVWEITGAEFSQSTNHTAGGVSIRFPRVTRIRDDKDWNTATDLQRLKTLYEKSKENLDITLPLASTSKDSSQDDEEEMEVNEDKKRKRVPEKATPVKKRKIGGSITLPSVSTSKDSAQSDEEEMEVSKDKKRKRVPEKATPVKKRKTESEREVCKYGVKCYQTNEEHRKRFSHPWETALGVYCAGTKIVKPLPDIFDGVKALIDPSLSEAKDIKRYITDIERYIIAYNGDVVSDIDISEVTHVFTKNKKFATDQGVPDGVAILSPDWVWDSLGDARLHEIANYEL